jgi:hypothetical protein
VRRGPQRSPNPWICRPSMPAPTLDLQSRERVRIRHHPFGLCIGCMALGCRTSGNGQDRGGHGTSYAAAGQPVPGGVIRPRAPAPAAASRGAGGAFGACRTGHWDVGGSNLSTFAA